MDRVRVEYIEPVRRAWSRMLVLLFQPFDLGKWFALGFTAWLATLVESGGGNFGSGIGDGSDIESLRTAWHEGLSEYVFVIIVVVAIVFLLGLALSLLLSWVQARGKFMFLDNVLNDRALIAAPWKQFRRQGNILFLWNIGYGLLMFILFISVLALAVWLAYPHFTEGTGGLSAVLGIGFGALFLVLLTVVSAYIRLFLNDFIVPIMWRGRLGVLAGWKAFLVLFRKNFWAFLLYGLLRLLLAVLIAAAIFAIVLATCCLAGCLLMIPYIGTVAVLPFLVFDRALGPEFLRQFALGDDPSEAPPS